MADFNHSYISKLVSSAQFGDSDAFAELYALTYKHIFNYAAHFLRDSDLAQDAVQDTYISALKNINSIKDPSLFVAWLNQICFRTCYDMYYKKNKSHEIEPSELLEHIKDDYPGHDPELTFENDDEITQLNEAIKKLPFNEQQVVVMRYYNELKLEDIAKALRISRSSVKRYLKSAIESLSKILKKGVS